MSVELILLGIYVVGLFPAAARATRWHASRGHCHHEDRFGGRDRYNHADARWCGQFHRPECWRSDAEVQVRDLRATPLALIWPLALLGVLILAQARKRPAGHHDLERSISDLERELGIEGDSK